LKSALVVVAEALEENPSRPDRVWSRIPDDIRDRIVAMALGVPELSPRELATRFTDTESCFVSESSVYRLLKAHDLIASPAFIPMSSMDDCNALPLRSNADAYAWRRRYPVLMLWTTLPRPRDSLLLA
jgi:hypothetical protein